VIESDQLAPDWPLRRLLAISAWRGTWAAILTNASTVKVAGLAAWSLPETTSSPPTGARPLASLGAWNRSDAAFAIAAGAHAAPSQSSLCGTSAS